MLCKAGQEWPSNHTTVTDTKMIEAMKGDGVTAVESWTEVSSLVIQAFLLLAFPLLSLLFFTSRTCYGETR
jgi:hypothetical protein